MSRNREADWDDGPPGAEADYATHAGAARRGGGGDRHYATYELSARAGGHRVEPRRARSRSSTASPEPRARGRRRRTSSSSDSSGPRSRRRYAHARKETPKRQTKSHHSDKGECQSSRATYDSSSNRERSIRQTTAHTTHKHRERSITPPKSYKKRTTSSSSSGSSSMDSRSVSHSASRSPSRSRSPAVQRRSRSSASSESRERSPSPRGRHSDSSSSSRGRFSGYDRKRYFRKLKEQQAMDLLKKESDEKSEEKLISAPAGAVRPDSEDVAQLEYGDPPPLDGVNFEDLPPPPAALCGRGAPSGRRPPAAIPNDGSFLEMFKRMQETQKAAEVSAESSVVKRPVLPLIGKRRGGRVLKTGLVKKLKAPQEPADNAPKDAWSLYMQEVKKYRETSCEEERKTRPLVK